jgi:hypothetical protein
VPSLQWRQIEAIGLTAAVRGVRAGYRTGSGMGTSRRDAAPARATAGRARRTPGHDVRMGPTRSRNRESEIEIRNRMSVFFPREARLPVRRLREKSPPERPEGPPRYDH